MQNDQLVALDNVSNVNDYQIRLQIPNCSNENSKAYIYPKNETKKKVLLINGNWNDHVNLVDYKTVSNEVLFIITK